MQRLDFAPLSRTLEDHGLRRRNLVLEAIRKVPSLAPCASSRTRHRCSSRDDDRFILSADVAGDRGFSRRANKARLENPCHPRMNLSAKAFRRVSIKGWPVATAGNRSPIDHYGQWATCGDGRFLPLFVETGVFMSRPSGGRMKDASSPGFPRPSGFGHPGLCLSRPSGGHMQSSHQAAVGSPGFSLPHVVQALTCRMSSRL